MWIIQYTGRRLSVDAHQARWQLLMHSAHDSQGSPWRRRYRSFDLYVILHMTRPAPTKTRPFSTEKMNSPYSATLPPIPYLCDETSLSGRGHELRTLIVQTSMCASGAFYGSSEISAYSKYNISRTITTTAAAVAAAAATMTRPPFVPACRVVLGLHSVHAENGIYGLYTTITGGLRYPKCRLEFGMRSSNCTRHE